MSVKAKFERGLGTKSTVDGVLSVDKSDWRMYLGDGTSAHALNVYANATQSVAGLMSTEDKAFLDATNKYVVCTTAGNVANKVIALDGFTLKTGARLTVKFTSTTSAKPSSGNITINVNNTGDKNVYLATVGSNLSQLTYDSTNYFYGGRTMDIVYDGTEWLVIGGYDSNTTYNTFTGATETAVGTTGLVPAPGTTDAGKFLKADGTWAAANNYSLPTASNTQLGGVKTGAAVTDTTGMTAVHIKDGVIYYTNTTYGAEKGITLTSGKFGHSNTAVTAVTTAGLYKVKYDAYGHITGTTDVAKTDITALGIPSQDTTYGAEKGITLTSGKFGHSNTAVTATTSASYLVKYDAYGHVTGSDQAVAITEAEINTICV